MTEDVPYCQHKQDAQVMFAIIKKKYPVKPNGMSVPMKALWNVCKGCWVHDPNKRLKIRDVVRELSLINSTVQSRALIKIIAVGKRERTTSPSPFSKRLKMAHPKEVFGTHPMPDYDYTHRSGQMRRLTVVCAEVRFVLLRNTSHTNALFYFYKCKRLKLRCDRKSPCSTCVKRGTIVKCTYFNQADAFEKYVIVFTLSHVDFSTYSQLNLAQTRCVCGACEIPL